ncbi:50S ribosomal protein L3 [Candidatus Woesearchaeota archaeon]|nr:50S ribosomal protein L3 [Candidatus Woesearchaeota archaeon]
MKKRNPRHGSMQFWPRVKAKKPHARIRSWTKQKKGVLGFAGYKIGMTHLMITDNKPTSQSKGKKIFCPASLIECPSIKVAAVNFYKKSRAVLRISSQIMAQNLDKELKSKMSLPKKQKNLEFPEFDDLRLLVYTQPRLTGVGKKKPEVFEMEIGGSKEEKSSYAKEKLGKEISIEEVFQEGEQIDVHAVTKGRGFTGPVKRFGITLKSHKSEKNRRNPGSLGGWTSQGHVMYRIAHAGQHGFHQRTEYNKHLLKIGKDAKEVQEKGGFLGYGLVKNPYIIIKGSVPGSRKRLVKLTHAIRPDKLIPKEPPVIDYISKESKQ